MLYTIKGLTDLTITINSLNLTIRGSCKDTLKYPHSIAKSIDVVNEEQMSDLRGLIRAGFISIEPEQAEEQPKLVHNNDKKALKKVKPIKLVKNKNQDEKQSNALETEESDVVMFSGEGTIVRGKSGKSKGKTFDNNSEIVRASLEAARKMEEEEAIPPYQVDESKLDESDKMGSDAIIATGNKMTSAKVKMKRSVVPESNLTNAINWIDQEQTKDTSKDAFIDGDNDKRDNFIE